MTTIRTHESFFEGAVSVHETPAGLAPVRLPVDRAALFPSPDDTLMARAWGPSGVRLRFATDSRHLEVVVEPADTATEPRIVDLTRDGALLASREIPSEAGLVAFDLPELQPTSDAAPVYELWLHPFHPTRVAALRVDDGAVFGVPTDRRPRWITYGSSITMCRSATSPARTWPAIAARAHDLNLTSLGFGGQCHLDPMIARVIRDLPADLITLKLGINVYGSGSLNARTYPGAVVALVAIIRERHPDTPIGVITSIVSPDRERTPNATGCTLEDYREMTRDAVRRLTEAGDRRLLLFEGTELFGNDDVGMLPDGLHPNGEGYELMGARMAERFVPRLLAV
jgi:hypothetical protein